MTPYLRPLCTNCKHLFRYPERHRKTCKAFPDGVPIEIAASFHDHRKPYPGDNGIMFESKEEYANGTNGI
jgi:hypothetical protein